MKTVFQSLALNAQLLFFKEREKSNAKKGSITQNDVWFSECDSYFSVEVPIFVEG